jgi:CheY-like chemotaxis protein
MAPHFDRETLRGLRVLVIDDNHDTADGLRLLLQAWGCDVRACYSGMESLPAAGELKPHVVLVDLRLPDLSGYEVAQRIQDGTRHLIAVTAQEPPLGDCERAGFVMHLLKPVHPDLLHGVLALFRGSGILQGTKFQPT